MPLLASTFQPPPSLRNAHVQSVLASSPLRARYAARQLARAGATHAVWQLDGGDGVLQGTLSQPRDGTTVRGLAVLLHGWEGSAESNYIRAGAAHLLEAGFEVFRLNFRDHGDTHHLNAAIFHSGRIDEVVHAVGDLVSRLPTRPLLVGGWSLGGNFALRLALRADRAGLPLAGVAAVCPAVDPAATMDAMETGLPLYLRYFEHKWRRSLARKRALFPEQHAYDNATLRLRMRPLTAHFVERHTDYGSLDGYFDAYSIAGERLADLPLPAHVLMAADDPVVPSADVRAIARHPHVHVELAPHGGHCGFLCDWRMHGYAERWMTRHFLQALEADPA